MATTSQSDSISATFLPTPSAAVGFTRFSVTDVNRASEKNRQPHRCFEVLAWYPAEAGIGSGRKPYLSNHRIAKLWLFNWHFGRKKTQTIVRTLRTNAIEGAPVSDRRDQYPVILFSHDIGRLPEYYTSLMEHLASDGYFVFSINHAGLSEECVIHCPTANKQVAFPLRYARFFRWYLTAKRSRRLLVGKPYTDKWNLSKALMRDWKPYHQDYIAMQADRNALINLLYELTSDRRYEEFPYAMFARRLDLSSIGAMGHGWGGASAVDSLIHDPRVKTAINLDGLQFSNAVDHVISKPLCTIYSEQFSGINEGIYFSSSANEAHTINETTHEAFTDWPFFDEKQQNQKRALFTVAGLSTAFLDKYLKKNEGVPLQTVRSQRMTIL